MAAMPLATCTVSWCTMDHSFTKGERVIPTSSLTIDSWSIEQPQSASRSSSGARWKTGKEADTILYIQTGLLLLPLVKASNQLCCPREEGGIILYSFLLSTRTGIWLQDALWTFSSRTCLSYSVWSRKMSRNSHILVTDYSAVSSVHCWY